MNIGDKVQFTNIVRRNGAIEMKTKKGEIVAIDGDIVTVKYGGNHRRKKLRKSALRLIGQRSELTDFAMNTFAANRPC